MESGDAPELPARPKQKTPPPATPMPDPNVVNEQERMLKEYEAQQAALKAAQAEDERHRQEQQLQAQLEFQRRQQEQEEAQRQAQQQLLAQQQMYQNQQVAELESQLLQLRGQYERDQIFLEQYDRV